MERVVDTFAKESTAQSRRLVASFLVTLRQWNKKLDLTAAKTEDELVDLFVADAAVLAARLPRDAHVVDVGSGAGAPGFVLALLRPDLQLTLIEPLAKRTSFLRTFWARECEPYIPTLRILREPVAAARDRGETFDVALSRATFEPSAWLEVAQHLLRPPPESEGNVPFAVVLHAREDAPAGPASLRKADELRYSWPLTHRERQLTEYPRSTG